MSGQKTKTGLFFWLATAVLLLAATMRLAFLQDIPPGLSQDEVLNADLALFIRQGQHALFFREGYGHEPLYHYWSVPFQVLLGDNVLSIRLPAVYLGLLLVAITMRWVKRDYGTPAALITGLGLAITWWPIIFSRIGLRPIMEPLLLVLGVWFWQRRPWLAGLFIGLSIYTYTAARYAFLIPLTLIVYLLLFHRKKWKAWPDHSVGYSSLRSASIVFAVSFIMFIPLALTLRNDPALQQRVEQLSEPLDDLRQGDPRPLTQSTLATLGVFSFTGDPRSTYSLPGRTIFDPISSLLFYFGLGMTFVRWRKPKHALVLIWFLLALLPSAVTPDAPSTVRMVGAMPLVFLMPGIAISFMITSWRRGRTIISANVAHFIGYGLLLLLTVLLAFNFWRTIDDGFNSWPHTLDAKLKYQSVLLDMARHWEQNPVQRLVLADAFSEPIDTDTFRRDVGHSLDARWVNASGAIIYPQGVGQAYFYVPEYVPLSGALLEVAEISSTPFFRSESEPSFAIYSLPDRVPEPSIPLKVVFDEIITFIGYDMIESKDEPALSLYTFWRVEADLPPDIAIFVHLLTPDGDIGSQHDGFDALPQTLRVGDIIIQQHNLDITGMNQAEDLTLQLGLYRRSNNQRFNYAGDPPDRVILNDGLAFDWPSEPR